MISCNKGICKIEGSLETVFADLGCMIHAIDQCITADKDADTAKKFIEDSVKFALEHRDIPADKIIDEKSDDPLDKALTRIEALLQYLIKEVDDGK